MANIISYFTRNRNSNDKNVFVDIPMSACTIEEAKQILARAKLLHTNMSTTGGLKNMEPPELWANYDDDTEKPMEDLLKPS